MMYMGIIFLNISLLLMLYYYYQDYIVYTNVTQIIDQYDDKEVLLIDDLKVDDLIEIPIIHLKLPIFNECNKQSLDRGCALYYQDDHQKIICGHNTSSVFKKIRKLKYGDHIYVGNQLYLVDDIEVIKETSIDEMINSIYELSLFTCTDDSKSRYTIRCRQL